MKIKVIKPASNIYFQDLSRHWAHNSVIKVVADGIMEGVQEIDNEDYNFSPNTPVSRAEFLATAMKAAKLTDNININFKKSFDNDIECTVRIATTDFIQGNVPDNTKAFIDVDVYTKPNIKITNIQQVKDWVESAHDVEKEQFFSLLTQDSIDAMEEKYDEQFRVVFEAIKQMLTEEEKPKRKIGF